MFKHTYEMRYGDFKDFNTIKLSSVLDVIQDVATKHSNFCGYGMHKLHDMNLAWLLQGIKLHINTPVKTFSDITAVTGIKDMRGATSERATLIQQNGETAISAVANWFLFDTSRLRPCRIPPEILSAYPKEETDERFLNYEKIQTQDAEEIRKIIVSNKEIDTNNHLNNQKSAEILLDALPVNFSFQDMNILYKKSAFLGDELTLCVKSVENGYYAHLKNQGDEICVAGTFFY